MAGAFAAALLSGAQAQGNPYGRLVLGASEVIVHAPELWQPQAYNALRVAVNSGVRVTLLTTVPGAMSENGLIMRLIILRVPTLLMPPGGDQRQFMQVRHGNTWRVYDIAGENPREGRMYDHRDFNAWYASHHARLPTVVRENAFAAWTRANMGVTLSP